MYSKNRQIVDSSKNNYAKEVLELVVFFDLLNKPLTLSEVEAHLRMSGYNGVDVNKLLESDPLIESDGEYFFLKGRFEIVHKHRNNKVYERKFRAKVDKYVVLLRHIPFVEAAAYCNNLSFGSVDKNSDIDLFVITKRGRIYTARIFLTLLFHLFGVRRHGKKTAGRFCLSFFVAGSDFALKDIALADDCYLYFWGRSLVPVYNVGVIADFMNFNGDFLRLNAVSEYGRVINGYSGLAVLFENLLGGKVGDFLERRLGKWHKKRFEKRKKNAGPDFGVVVNDSMLKFHNTDKRAEFARAYMQKMDCF